MPHIYATLNWVSNGSDNAIIETNAGLLLIRPLGTNFNEILIKIQKFSFTKMHLKRSSAKWRPDCLRGDVCYVSAKSLATFIVSTTMCLHHFLFCKSVVHGPLARCVKLRVAHVPGMSGTFSPATAGYRARHASRHVRDARTVMHAGIAI